TPSTEAHHTSTESASPTERFHTTAAQEHLVSEGFKGSRLSTTRIAQAGFGLTRRCSGLASLAAELHIVRPRWPTLRGLDNEHRPRHTTSAQRWRSHDRLHRESLHLC